MKYHYLTKKTCLCGKDDHSRIKYFCADRRMHNIQSRKTALKVNVATNNFNGMKSGG